MPDFYDTIRGLRIGVRSIFVGVVDAIASIFGIIRVKAAVNWFLVVEVWFFGLVGFVAEVQRR